MENLHELFGDSEIRSKPRTKNKVLFPRNNNNATNCCNNKKSARRRLSKETISNNTDNQQQRPSAVVSESVETCEDDRIDWAPLESLPPEPEVGNVEYKLKLLNPTRVRFEHLVTQMKWRLREGQGEAIYEIGVEDNGTLSGLGEHELETSLDTLSLMASRLGATVKVLRQRNSTCRTTGELRFSAEVLVRKVPDDCTSIELRIAVLGNADVGKSTLLGVLTQGDLDNGRGRARLIMFRHLHEVQTGRTSSISHGIMGFDCEGNVKTYQDCQTAEEIVEKSAKLITFIDLAGHYKYLHTTIFGLTGYCPHYIMLVVSANTGMAGTTVDHLNLALALNAPFFVVMTKIDVTPGHIMEQTVRTLREFLKAETRRDGLLVETVDDVSRAVKGVKEKGNVVPIFKLSSVTGFGLGLLKEFLHILPPYLNTLEREQLEKERVQFQIDESWNIPEVGAVVGGLLTKGVITENMRLKLGPVGRGEFMPIIVKTIHRNKANCCVVRASQSASLSLCPINDSPANRLPRLRKGMVLLDPCQESRVAKHFMAKLTLSGCQQQQPQQNQSGAEDGYPVFLLRKGGHATLHIGNVRQGAAVRGVFGARNLEPRNDAWIVSCHPDDEPVSVMFEFLRGPEYLEQGARVLFRVAGETRGQGFVSHIYYSDSSSSTSSLTSGSSSSCDEPFLESE